MADTKVTVANRRAAYATLIETQVTSQMNRSVPLLQLLTKKPADGKNISWTAKFGTAVHTTAAIADGTAVTNYNADTKVTAYLDYTTYHDAFGVGGLIEALARIAGGPGQMTDLVLDELNDSNERLCAAMGRDVYYGTGANDQVMGLIDATAGAMIATGTYAGLDRSTYTQWASNVVSAGGGAVTIEKMRELSRKIGTASAKQFDFWMATPIVFDQIAAVTGGQRRMVQEVNLTNRGVIKLDGGFTAIEFDGKPVFKDDRLAADTATATSGKLLAINAKETMVRYVPNPTSAQILRSIGLRAQSEPQLGSEQVGLMAKIKELGPAGDISLLELLVYWNVQVRQCNANGQINSINELVA